MTGAIIAGRAVARGCGCMPESEFAILRAGRRAGGGYCLLPRRWAGWVSAERIDEGELLWKFDTQL